MLDELNEINPKALAADGFEGAVIGYVENHHHPAVLLYDSEECIRILVERDGMSEEDAREYFEINTLGAYMGENGPLFMNPLRTDAAKAIIQEWIAKQGHNRCWYYPDLFRQLADLFGIECPDPGLPPEEEFKKGCDQYRQEEYSKKQ